MEFHIETHAIIYDPKIETLQEHLPRTFFI